MQKDFTHFSDNILPNFLPMNYQQLLKNHLLISYKENNYISPLEMMNSSHLLDEYCRLLKFEINRLDKESWLILKNPENFLSKENIRFIVNEFEKINMETKQLKVFFLSDHYLDLEYTVEDIEKTIILGETAEQLPPYSELLRSIKLRYPEKYTENQDLLLKRLYRIFPYLGTNSLPPFLFSKDIILLKILTEMIGICWNDQKIMVEELTPIEKSFLF
ncbi:MAG: hypothetical protein IC227_02585 [Enterococcus lacertideformus]|uniref:Uncharacterized protein n=1 Tax=Enterococcus lacertideformus TaxID=2771493 RepID=A0A931B1C7_9ENTE|nr:hypothetical protein [Enterococcus lacertideformus]